MAVKTYILLQGLPKIRMEEMDNGDARFYVETPNGDGRFMEIRYGGSHIEIHAMKSLPAGNALELDAEGYPQIHKD